MSKLEKKKDLEFTPGFTGKQSERELTGLILFECFSNFFDLKIHYLVAKEMNA
jgi:hypothetical protein